MAMITFTPNLFRHVQSPSAQVEGATVRQALDAYFQDYPEVRGYVLDDQDALRKHMAIFLNQELIQDRTDLSELAGEDDEIFVVQALSGG